MEEFGERIIKVIDGNFSETQYITIDLDDKTITIRGILNHQTHMIKNFIDDIEIIHSEREKTAVIAKFHLKNQGKFTAKMERGLYKQIKKITD